MPRRRQFSSGFNRGVRRLTSWDLGPGQDSVGSADVTAFASTTTQLIGSGVTPFAVDNLTIVRIRGQIEFMLTAADAIRSGFGMVMGIGIVSADAFAAGVASVPNPLDDAEWPGWLWWGHADIRTSLAALAAGDPTQNPVVIPIDTKAMRKFRLNEVLFMSVQAGETGTSTMDVRGVTRVLVKLP